MPPEPLPWDRKDFFKERKHERSSDSLGGPVSRWRDSPHHHGRWGSAEFRTRPPGNGKQGGWHLYSEESGNGFTPSRSNDDNTCRPSGSRADGKHSRNGREYRGSFSQKDWKGHSWENGASPNGPGRPLDGSDQRSVDGSDLLNTWDQLHFKDPHDNRAGGVNGLGTGQKFEKENSTSSIDWKPIKWNRSGSMSSRGSGLSHSSSSKSMGVDSGEAKAEAQLRNVTPVQSPSGDAVACATSAAAPSEETSSKKKPRLGWGEGLAKYEKKKVDGPDDSATKQETGSCGRTEPLHSHVSNSADKSPRVAGLSECASPATPSSVACSFSPGAEDKQFVKAASMDYDIGNLSGSPNLLSQSHLGGRDFNLGNLDLTSISDLSSSISELLQTDDPSSLGSSFGRYTGMNKLLVWKGNILKALEMAESEIEPLENELKSLISESGNSCPCPATSSSLLGECQAKPHEEPVVVSHLIPRPSPLQLDSSGDMIVEKAVSGLEDKHAKVGDEGVDSPGTVTSKYVELLSSSKGAAQLDPMTHCESSGDLDSGKSGNLELKGLVYGSNEEKTGGISASEVGDQMIASKSCAAPRVCVSSHCDMEDILYDQILASNKDCASRASEVFSKLLPSDQCHIDISRSSSISSWTSDPLVQEKFLRRKRFLRFKERVITLKFRAFQHLWKEDMRLLSIRKYRAKSQRRMELILRAPYGSNQKHRSSIRARSASAAGNLSLVPTSEVINFTSKVLSDSQVKPYRDSLKMPALILDKNENIVSRFISRNCLVEDPCAVEKERVTINPWSSKDKEIFMDKLTTFGKDFGKIASFLDHKTTADCIEFYYKNHKSDCFAKTKKKPELGGQGKSYSTNNYLVTSGKRWNRQIDAASLDMLGVASAIAANADDGMENQNKSTARFRLGASSDYRVPRGDDGFVERSGSLERETVAADVLAGIGSLSSEAMSSCVTSSFDPVVSLMRRPLTPEVTQNVDDGTCSDESCGEMDPTDWTDEEKSIFIQAVSSYGKDFVMISRCVRTRSRDQCKVFFSKARKCLGLDMIHPRPGDEGMLLNDDANGGGSDNEDAGVVENGSVICSEKSGSKMDENMISDLNAIHCESDPAETMNLQSELDRSEENNVGEKIDCKDAKLLPEYLVTDDLQGEDKLKLGVDGDSKMEVGVDNMSVIVQAPKHDLPLDTEVEGCEDTGEASCLGESVSTEEANDHGLSTSGAEGESIAVDQDSTDHLMTEPERQLTASEDHLNEKQAKNMDANISRPSDLNGSDQALHTKVDASDLAADLNAPVVFGPEQEQKISPELNPLEEPLDISLEQDVPPVDANSSAKGRSGSQYVKTLNQDTSSTLDFEKIGAELCKIPAIVDDYNQHQSGHSQILMGYPLPMSTKKEMNGDISSKKMYFQSLSKVDRSFHSDNYLSQDCLLQKCNTSNAQSSVPELPFVSQEHRGNHSRAHSWSSSDTGKPSRNGDVKLFGQILTHKSSLQKLNGTGVHENEGEEGVQHPKLSSNNFNQKCNGTNGADASPVPAKFDQNNFSGLENVPIRSYGFWDGNRIQTGFSTLPDSAILLAKYPAAFGNYSTSSANMEQQPLHSAVKSNDRSLNGVSVFSRRDMGSSNGVAEYHLYRNREGARVQPFTVDVKQRQDIMFTEMQRRNAFEPVSSVQPPARGMVGINVVGRGGILVGGACTGVSDPVAAIKMHYAKTEPFNGQTPGIIREEESWRGKGDVGR